MAVHVSVLIFQIDDRRYGLRASDLVEVTRAVEVVPLPKAPPIVEGIVDFHGTLVPVVDVRARFGHAPREIDPSQHMIVARAAGRSIAFLVDATLDLLSLADADIVAPDAVWRGVPYVAGIAKTRDGVLVIQDLHAFLSQAESALLDAALSTPADAAEQSR